MGGNSNLFLALANTLCEKGEDMEGIARDLALAFYEIAKEANNGNTPEQEFARFTKEEHK